MGNYIKDEWTKYSFKKIMGSGGELDESGQNVQASRYKINKPLECNVQHD